eukprot:m.184402 g.184402  ORF g.184402 m.184402 type:complete len:69 (+) comp39318_c4_seq36:587-793(+)
MIIETLQEDHAAGGEPTAGGDAGTVILIAQSQFRSYLIKGSNGRKEGKGQDGTKVAKTPAKLGTMAGK